jgi:hypothetical protein
MPMFAGPPGHVLSQVAVARLLPGDDFEHEAIRPSGL